MTSVRFYATLTEAETDDGTNTITEAQIGNSFYVSVQFSENMLNVNTVLAPIGQPAQFVAGNPNIRQRYTLVGFVPLPGATAVQSDQIQIIAHDADFTDRDTRCRAAGAAATDRYLCLIHLSSGQHDVAPLSILIPGGDQVTDLADNALAADYTSSELTLLAPVPPGVTSVTHYPSVAAAQAGTGPIATTWETRDPIYSVIQFAGPVLETNASVSKVLVEPPAATPPIFHQLGSAARVQFGISHRVDFATVPPPPGYCQFLDSGNQGDDAVYWCSHAPSVGDSGNYKIIVGAEAITETGVKLGADWDMDTGITLAVPAEPLVFSSQTVADRIYPITLGSGTNRAIPIPDLVLPGATGGSGTLNYALSPPASAGISGLSLSLSRDRIVGTPTQVGSQVFIYTVTDSATPDAQTASLTFKISVVDVQGDGTAVADTDGTALAVNNVGTTDHNLRLLLPDGHTVNTVTVNTHTPTAGTELTGYTFSGVAMDIDLRPASADSIPDNTEATVCLSTTGVPDTNHDPALFLGGVGTGGTGWDNIGIDTTTFPGFVCGVTDTFVPYFAVASMPTTPTDAAPTLAYAGTFTETAANDGTVEGSITATLTGDTFAADVVSGAHVTASNVPAGLTTAAAVAGSTYATGMIDFNDTTTITARMNEQVLSRASQAITANVLPRLAARIEAAAGSGINSIGTGDPAALAYQFGGQSSMRGLLQAHGKSMLEGEMDYERLLDASSFVMPLSAAGDESDGKLGGLSLWGGADFSDLDGNADDLDWDGEVISFHLGVDSPVGNNMLAGLALSLNTASFDYTNEDESGDYEYTTTNLHPYFGYIHNDKLNFWGAAGFGQGEIETNADGAAKKATDTTNLSVAGGFSNQILRAPGRLPDSVTTLSVKSDASFGQVEVDKDETAGFASQEIDSHHLRLLVSGEQRRELAGGGSLAPSMEIGVRYDGGDGETGSGVEVGTGVRYAHSGGKLTLAGNVRSLKLDGYDALGADFTVRLAPQSGRGLSLSLQPVWGQTQSTAERLWDDGINELSGDDKELRSRMDSEVGYGLAATMLGSAGVLTPYAGMTTADGGVNHLRLGGRFAGGTGLRLNLEGVRENGSDDASHTVLLRGELAF